MVKNSLSKVFYLETKYWLRDYYVFVFLEIKFLEKYRPYSTLKFWIWNIAWNDPQYVVNFNDEFNWYHVFEMTTLCLLICFICLRELFILWY